MSEKVRIFKKSAHFFAFSYTHFKEKCVTLHTVFPLIMRIRSRKKLIDNEMYRRYIW